MFSQLYFATNFCIHHFAPYISSETWLHKLQYSEITSAFIEYCTNQSKTLNLSKRRSNVFLSSQNRTQRARSWVRLLVGERDKRVYSKQTHAGFKFTRGRWLNFLILPRLLTSDPRRINMVITRPINVYLVERSLLTAEICRDWR